MNITLKNIKGLTLVEVMVALVILSVGMLGLAALQITGIRGAAGSNYRVQAVLLVNDVADRMHTNVTSVNDDNSFANIDVTFPAANCPVMGVDCSAAAANCTELQLANYDISDVCQSITAYLPQPVRLQVTCNDNIGGDGDACTNGSTHTVTLTWTEVTDSAVNVGLGAGLRNQNVAITVTP